MYEIKKDLDNLKTVTQLVYEKNQLAKEYNRLLIVVIVLGIGIAGLMYEIGTLLTLLNAQ